jgi:hypothetical protein
VPSGRGVTWTARATVPDPEDVVLVVASSRSGSRWDEEQEQAVGGRLASAERRRGARAPDEEGQTMYGKETRSRSATTGVARYLDGPSIAWAVRRERALKLA